jgi:hypothetical protein
MADSPVEQIGYLCVQGYPKRICSGCTSACCEPVFAYLDTHTYSLLAVEDDGQWSRLEMREYGDRYQAVRMRKATDGGWYVQDTISINKRSERDRP